MADNGDGIPLGVRVEHRRFEGQIHAFYSIPLAIPAAAEAQHRSVEVLREGRIVRVPKAEAGFSYRRSGFAGDIMELKTETLWSTKGSASPGAVDMSRREPIMDLMGIDQQLLFAKM